MDRILIVHPKPDPVELCLETARECGLLAQGFLDSEAALTFLREGGAVSALLIDPESFRAQADAWHETLAMHAPHASRLLLAEQGGSEACADLLRDDQDLTCLEVPLETGALQTRLQQAVEHSRRHRDTQVQGSESAPLLHAHALEALFQFSLALFDAQDLGSMAHLASHTLGTLFPNRAHLVELWDPRDATSRVQAGAYGSCGAELVRVPLEIGDAVVGELVVDVRSSVAGPLAPEDIRTLYLVAAPLAAATQGELHRRERDRAQGATLMAMAKVAEMRDNETGQHLLRVSRYAELIARGLREDGHYVELITEEFIRDVVRCAPLHDLGKVAIPDAVLLKRGRLTEEEWALMKTHPEWGARILREMVEENADLSFVSMGAEIAHFHHERWDGAGYPAGLAGEQIPLSARIVSLADIYDALTTPRPYKLSWSPEAVLEHLENLSGNALDPNIVASFLKRRDLALEIQQRFGEPAAVHNHSQAA
ncbi:MAG: HD domain-containing protein [Planctomycetota bacterium]